MHLDSIALVVNSFDRSAAKSIQEAQDLLKKPSVKADLSYIESHLGFMATSITQLEEAGLPLTESLAIVEKARKKINSIPGQKGKIFKEKIDQVLKKNGGLEVLKQVGKVLEGDEACELPAVLSASQAASLKFCPISSCDVERSFSQFKNLLSDRRHSFTEGNLAKVAIVNYFYARNEK